MKKILLVSYILASSVVLFSQPPVVDTISQPLINVADATVIADAAYTIGTLANGGNNFIPNVPNGVLHTVTLLVIGLVVRFFERRHLKKKLLK